MNFCRALIVNIANVCAFVVPQKGSFFFVYYGISIIVLLFEVNNYTKGKKK